MPPRTTRPTTGTLQIGDQWNAITMSPARRRIPSKRSSSLSKTPSTPAANTFASSAGAIAARRYDAVTDIEEPQVCSQIPRPPTIKPPPQQAAATVPTIRGPTCSSHLPAKAAESSRKTSAMVNIQATCTTVQYSALNLTAQRTLRSGRSNVLQTYTEPMQR